jgi:formiminotetrahydrofolate cyclodeaminase
LDDDATSMGKSQALLALPANQLLAKFGSGGHKPGSGSAAALSGMLACKLASTVTHLTQSHEKYKDVHAQMTLLRNQLIGKIEPELVRLFNQDSEQFGRVIRDRLARDSATDPREKRRLREVALESLKAATETPIRIAEVCLDVAENALIIYDIGFQSARGDSGVAVSTALSATNGALFVAFLNLTQFREGEWAVTTRTICDVLLIRAQELQSSLFERVTRLQNEGNMDAQLELL